MAHMAEQRHVLMESGGCNSASRGNSHIPPHDFEENRGSFVNTPDNLVGDPRHMIQIVWSSGMILA